MAKFYRTEDRTVLLELFGAGSSVENLKNLKANTTDAAVEKHVPVVTQEGNKITVAVSSVEHPMLPEHYIMGVYIETKKPIDIDKVFELLSNSTGVELYDDIENQVYPMANLFVGDQLVHVGRVRKDLDNPNALSLWVVADQLMKGAAYNSVDIGLKMIEMGLL